MKKKSAREQLLYQDIEPFETRESRMPKVRRFAYVYRSDKPHIDECGFESYNLKCKGCGSMLVGIIDPADDKLPLTVSP